jgi:hypothetical protein
MNEKEYLEERVGGGGELYRKDCSGRILTHSQLF